ncbi:MAG: L-seryl-tRNA(Sec) selenium transferase [Dehalococcoidia bacterium]|nr:L-seryl-tRNA(Sec) selenium transferase [Dehalococcoidia bacterium]
MTATPDPAYRDLPSVDRLLGDARVAPLIARHGREPLAGLARAVLAEYRRSIAERGRVPAPAVAEALIERAAALDPSLVRVVNATGVIIHTNLGRAPLSRATIEAMERAATGYSNLEYDTATGERGSRFSHLDAALCRVTGAEAGIAVNNNAAALLLSLAALCGEGEVIISRGQLVEIGGGFRIPDVLRQSGVQLVEVGTTNRTYLRDYAGAITERTAAILRVHASNFRIVGFVEQAPLHALAALAHERGLLLLDDLGSGALLDTRAYGLAPEPTVQQSVRAGADVVLCSGDKLLGGPQAGIAVGRAPQIEAMSRHPLARALRLDKTAIAGLAATIDHYARGDAVTEIPVWRMIATRADALGRRARRWSRACAPRATVEAARSTIGGGSLPGETLETVVCAVDPPAGRSGELSGGPSSGPSSGDAAAFAAALRAATPPIVARIAAGRVLLDPRTVDPRDDRHVARTLARLCAAAAEEQEPAAGR